ncbi:MAG: hypothetical protein HQL36_07970 [Alphaproteobacteria bacterium]|nr:hypothetical protein [Alphaproteobacteria bacterium]
MDKTKDGVIVAPETGANGTFKGKFRIRIIRAGLSGNGNFYPDQSLRDAAEQFNGARVFVKSDAEHIAAKGKDVRNLIGRISDVQFIAGDKVDAGELQGTLEMIEPEGPIAKMMKDAWDRGMTDLFGFSIDAKFKVQRGRVGGKPVQIAKQIVLVHSVDLIVDPGAGGQVLNLIESKGSHPMDEENILSTDDVRRLIEACGLPKAAKEKLIAENTPPSQVTEDDLREAIKREADYLAKFTESGHVKGLGSDGHGVRITEGRDAKVGKMLDAFFDPKDRSVVSIRECYLEITGDRHFTGLMRNCDQARLRESLGSGSFSDVLGDSIARRLVTEYRNDTIYDVWRNLANVVPVNDFRTQERTRFGGYGDLPTVSEGDPYTALNSPTDEKATYAVEKRGGTEDLTLEMITNDDVSAVQRIPTKLVRSAKRTLSKFVLDFLKTNPAIYDGVTLFHTDHGNLGSAALDAAAVAAGRLAMKSQTERDTNEKIGLGPRFLWVPDELEEAAVNLFRRSTEQDKTFLQSLTLDVVPVWYWDNVNDWCLTADPIDIPTVELGFLGANEEPELFVQDSPTAGSMFTHDKVTYKIRHIYGGTVTDYRGAYKSVVA